MPVSSAFHITDYRSHDLEMWKPKKGDKVMLRKMIITSCVPSIAALFFAGSIVDVAAQEARDGASNASATPTIWSIDVTFRTVRFDTLNDPDPVIPLPWDPFPSGGNPEKGQIYGALTANGSISGSDGAGVRSLGLWGNPTGSGCSSSTTYLWGTTAGACVRSINPSVTYDFGAAKLCTSSTYARCDTDFKYSNNTVKLHIRPGESIKTSVHIKDHDESSDDDDICNVETNTGPLSALQLDQLTSETKRYLSGSGSGGRCTVEYTLHKTGATY
ncbi:hypothetical protein [Streptomyces sp. NPDC057675]|uniref:hypothetical protein n=1 Tax=Streptomyces sp. NPDC057675 TaxID=3346204 RepID=UPI0036C7E819